MIVILSDLEIEWLYNAGAGRVYADLSTTPPDPTVTEIEYDIAGRKISMDDPDMGEWIYTYDALGNLVAQTDARTCTTSLTYDSLNRLTGKTFSNCPSTPSVTYYYDGASFTFNGTPYNTYTNPIGRRTGMVVSGSNAAIWKYDARGQVVSEIRNIVGGGAYETNWTYNAAGLPQSMAYPSQTPETVTFSYDDRMLLDRLTNGTTIYIDGTTYDSAGRLDVRTFGNGAQTDYNYHPWTQQGGRLSQIVTRLLDGSTYTSIQSLEYSYDAGGNVETITDALNGDPNVTQKQCFLYDDLDRLTRATTLAENAGDPVNALGCDDSPAGVANYNEKYSYDEYTGNLITNGNGTLEYNSQAHAHAVTDMGSNSFVYDANGNMTQRVVGGQTYTLAYDAEGRLVSVGGAFEAEFVYDGDGRRVQSEIGNTTTTFVGGHFEAVTSGSTTTYTKYYSAGVSRVAMRKDGHLYYLFGDHLGSTSLTVDTATNSVQSEIYYTAWGEIRYPLDGLNPGPSGYTYTGQYDNTGDFGLMYYNARWYDPYITRWTQPDTIVPDPLNSQAHDRYAYVFNNPIRYTDPSGHCPVCVVVVVGLKVLDWGWTAWDTYQSSRILANPTAGGADKIFAALNIGLGVVLEVAEPDDLFPVGLPLDDVGRKAIMKGAREAYEEGGQKALQKYLKESLGDHADDVFKKLDELLGYDKVGFIDNPGQMDHIFRKGEGHLLEDTIQNRNLLMDTVSSKYYQYTDEFHTDVFARLLDDGTEVWVEIFNGTIRDGGLNLIPRYH